MTAKKKTEPIKPAGWVLDPKPGHSGVKPTKIPSPECPLFIGGDVSLNHSGFVELDINGAMTRCYFVTARKTAVTKNQTTRHHGRHIYWPGKSDKHPEREERSVIRLDSHVGLAMGFFIPFVNPQPRSVYVAIEEYAYNSQAQTFSRAEVQGALKRELFRWGFAQRYHDPTSVKMFATNHGHAQKEEIQLHVAEQDMAAFSIIMKSTPFPEAQEDLCDAWVLAQMVRKEWLVRAGALDMRSVTDGERRVFNRTTKTNPINVLDRPWIQRPEVKA